MTGRVSRLCSQSLVLFGGVSSPYPFDGVRQELRLCVADAVAGVLAKQILVVVAPGLQHFSHAVVCLDPVVHAIAHDVGVETVAVANGHENPDGLLWGLLNELVVKAPGPIGRLRVKRPLLVHKSA